MAMSAGATVDVREITAPETLIAELIEYGAQNNRAIYRGQADSDWGLVPVAWRPNSPLGSLAENIRVSQSYPLGHFAGAKCDERLMSWLVAEHRVVENFCQACNEVAIRVPGYSLTWGSVQDPSNSSGDEIPANSYSEPYALARHHGLPTRLLDFSRNPLTALYFAAQDDCADDDGFLAVWCVRGLASHAIDAGDGVLHLDIASISRSLSAVEHMTVLRHEISYLHAQSGLFLVMNRSANAYFLEVGHWPAAEAVMHGWHLDKFVISRKHRHRILKLLSVVGLNEMVLKPSIEAIASVLNKRLAESAVSGKWGWVEF